MPYAADHPPCGVLLRPADYGRTTADPPPTVTPTEENRHRVAAGLLGHWLVLQALGSPAFLPRHRSVRGWARAHGLSYKRWSAIIAGHIHATVEDVALLVKLCGLEVVAHRERYVHAFEVAAGKTSAAPRAVPPPPAIPGAHFQLERPMRTPAAERPQPRPVLLTDDHPAVLRVRRAAEQLALGAGLDGIDRILVFDAPGPAGVAGHAGGSLTVQLDLSSDSVQAALAGDDGTVLEIDNAGSAALAVDVDTEAFAVRYSA